MSTIKKQTTANNTLRLRSEAINCSALAAGYAARFSPDAAFDLHVFWFCGYRKFEHVETQYFASFFWVERVPALAIGADTGPVANGCAV